MPTVHIVDKHSNLFTQTTLTVLAHSSPTLTQKHNNKVKMDSSVLNIFNFVNIFLEGIDLKTHSDDLKERFRIIGAVVGYRRYLQNKIFIRLLHVVNKANIQLALGGLKPSLIVYDPVPISSFLVVYVNESSRGSLQDINNYFQSQGGKTGEWTPCEDLPNWIKNYFSFKLIGNSVKLLDILKNGGSPFGSDVIFEYDTRENEYMLPLRFADFTQPAGSIPMVNETTVAHTKVYNDTTNAALATSPPLCNVENEGEKEEEIKEVNFGQLPENEKEFEEEEEEKEEEEFEDEDEEEFFGKVFLGQLTGVKEPVESSPIIENVMEAVVSTQSTGGHESITNDLIHTKSIKTR
eukprot:TRINITY_DN3102_c0_g3_i8.p1 TRINITY_DN3102_c0_g3~~TRINITY_DN3102_c0_g3_i8.p1  ORF type:complete len:350 (+),score=63.49 TRINITY_DN3102_c0_g3_i8:427-1476(+)